MEYYLYTTLDNSIDIFLKEQSGLIDKTSAENSYNYTVNRNITTIEAEVINNNKTEKVKVEFMCS